VALGRLGRAVATADEAMLAMAEAEEIRSVALAA
jgi:hypothetical protein